MKSTEITPKQKKTILVEVIILIIMMFAIYLLFNAIFRGFLLILFIQISKFGFNISMITFLIAIIFTLLFASLFIGVAKKSIHDLLILISIAIHGDEESLHRGLKNMDITRDKDFFLNQPKRIKKYIKSILHIGTLAVFAEVMIWVVKINNKINIGWQYSLYLFITMLSFNELFEYLKKRKIKSKDI